MRLVQAGVLDLDADVRKWLPQQWQLESGLGADPVAPTTLRQLLAHAAGTCTPSFGGYNRRSVLDGAVTVPDTIGVLAGSGNSDAVSILFPPGLASVYSGGGTTIVQLVVEQATGRPFADVLDELVFKPLGMAHSSIALATGPPNGGDVAAGHIDVCVPVAGGYHIYPELAAAGLWSTPTDLTKVLRAVFKSAQGELVDGAVFLSQDLAVDMLTTRFGRAMFGIGWHIDDDGFMHTGMNEGFTSEAWCSKRSGVGFVTAHSGEKPPPISVALAEAYGWTENVPKAGNWAHWSDKPQPRELVSPADCIGEYEPTDATLLKQAVVVRIERAEGDGDDAVLVHVPTLSGPVRAIRNAEDIEKLTFKANKVFSMSFERSSEGKMEMTTAQLKFVRK
nr:hypothetical protein HK105_002178 [Polyrhizophydium stewartii]